MKSTNSLFIEPVSTKMSGRDFLLSAATAARNPAEYGKIIKENFAVSYEAE